jgi:hypothetical protein
MVQALQEKLTITEGSPTDGERMLWATLHYMNGYGISRKANNYWTLTSIWENYKDST